MLRRLLLAVALLPTPALPAGPAPAAPAPAHAFRCPARGGPAWRTLRSAHLEVTTDLADRAADPLVRELETIWSVQVRALVGGDAKIPGRVRVVVFGDPALYLQLFGADDGGGRFLLGSFGEPTVVMAASRGQAALQAAAAALASHLSWYVYPRQAAWYHLGLATFLSSAALPVDAPAAAGQKGAPAVRDLGVATPALRDGLAHLAPVPARELLSWNGQRAATAGWERYPLWAWALYGHLRSARPSQLASLEARLADAEEPAAAWRAAFPDLDPADDKAMAGLDEALVREARAGARGYYRVAAAPAADKVTRARLPSAEVHALLLMLRQRWPEGQAAAGLARAELQETLREDPSQPIALARLIALDDGAVVVALRAAVKRGAARDWRAWLLLGGVLDPVADRAEREAALRRAAQLGPDVASTQDALARALLGGERAAEALPFANRAVDLAPADPAALDGLAQVVDALGHCPEALVLERRALERLGARPPEALQQRAEALQARCGR